MTTLYAVLSRADDNPLTPHVQHACKGGDMWGTASAAYTAAYRLARETAGPVYVVRGSLIEVER